MQRSDELKLTASDDCIAAAEVDGLEHPAYSQVHKASTRGCVHVESKTCKVRPGDGGSKRRKNVSDAHTTHVNR